jgi:LmbE family N-acetylglucosaminyl deacetylase
MNKSVLVIAAHADDEALGCGGTIAKHRSLGHNVEVMFMTDGVSSRLKCGEAEKIRRVHAAQLAANFLDINQIHFNSFPDNELDKISLLEVVQAIERLCDRIRPEIIYTHYHGDLNIDHRLTHQAVMTACRPQPGNSVLEIYGFEVVSSTEWNSPTTSSIFIPNCFVDISKFLELKIQAINAYPEEMRPPPHSRSIEHCTILAKHRGFSVGVNAAEAFAIYRLIR